METSLFVKAGPWHRITGVSGDGKAITGCGRNVYPSPMCSSIDTVEAGNGCPECLPEKASTKGTKEGERLVTIRETEPEVQAIVHAGEKIVPANPKRTRKGCGSSSVGDSFLPVSVLAWLAPASPFTGCCLPSWRSARFDRRFNILISFGSFLSLPNAC